MRCEDKVCCLFPGATFEDSIHITHTNKKNVNEWNSFKPYTHVDVIEFIAKSIQLYLLGIVFCYFLLLLPPAKCLNSITSKRYGRVSSMEGKFIGAIKQRHQLIRKWAKSKTLWKDFRADWIFKWLTRLVFGLSQVEFLQMTFYASSKCYR